jgi:hypothetical protein
LGLPAGALGPTPDADLLVTMERVPPILDRVQVTDTELCPGSPDRGAAFQLWDQARTGLLATVVAREAKPATAVTLVYERSMSVPDEIVRKQTTKDSHGRTTRPFIASAQPGFFARFGYMIENAGSRVFSAPDADVLLHESFALAHCFRLRAADDAHRGQVGVAFAPAPGPGRDTLVDVSGVIWMDVGRPQLRTLDFTYTSLEPAAMAARAGGRLEFRTMENGVSFIERWALRLPIVQVAPAVPDISVPGSMAITRPTQDAPRTARRDARLRQVDETGGLVVSASWEDGTRWNSTPSIVAGVVKGRRTGTPVPDAVVTLEGTDESTQTDVNGEFAIATIPGRYELRIVDTAFKDFSKERSTSQLVTIALGATQMLRLEMPPVGDVLSDACRGRRVPAGSQFVGGYLATTNASSVAGTRIQASWNEVVIHPANGRMLVPVVQTIDMKEEGRFVLCGVPPLRPVLLELYKDKTKLADTTFTLFTAAPTQRVMWIVPPLSLAAGLLTERGTRAPDVMVLDSVVPARPAENLRAFQLHVLTGLGTYIKDSMLASMGSRPLTEVLSEQVKTLRIWRVDEKAFVVAPSRTLEIPGFQNTSRCVSDVYYNGLRVWTPAKLGREIPFDLTNRTTDKFIGVEFYAADTRVPDGLVASPCGVLLLWTR